MNIEPEDVLGLVQAMDRVRDYNDKAGINSMWKELAAFLQKYPHMTSGGAAEITVLPFPNTNENHDPALRGMM